MKLIRCGILVLLCGAVGIALFSGMSSQAWAQTVDKSVVDRTPAQDPLLNEEQKTVPVKDSSLVVDDSIKTNVPQPDSLEKPALVSEPADTILQKEVLPVKTFRGSGQDVILGAITIAGWLFFMWLAANQGPN